MGAFFSALLNLFFRRYVFPDVPILSMKQNKKGIEKGETNEECKCNY